MAFIIHLSVGIVTKLSCIGLFSSYAINSYYNAVMNQKELAGLRIRTLRKSRGLSQEQLAEKTGISSKYLSSIERGLENPTFDTFIKLAEALQIELHELFNFFHEGKSPRELRAFIAQLIKDSDEEKLKTTAKFLKAVYL